MTRSLPTADLALDHGQVIVVGSINVDMVVRAPRLPTPAETVLGGTYGRHFGGKGANQAVAAARLGAQVTFVGAVGSDQSGDESIAALAAEGVDISLVARTAGTPTGVALIVVDEAGENQIVVAPGANSSVDARLVSSAMSSYAYTADGVLLANFEVPDEAVVAAARLAAANGMRVVLNPAPARALPDELVAARPILVPNRLEAKTISGEDDPEAAARTLSRRTGAPVIVTLGADGALVVMDADAEAVHLPAPHVRVVDTTGAGDTFVGALVAELSLARPLADAARVAVRAAAISVGAAGARGGMPTRAQLDAAPRPARDAARRAEPDAAG